MERKKLRSNHKLKINRLKQEELNNFTRKNGKAKQQSECSVKDN